jgi:hypothetical protein
MPIFRIEQYELCMTRYEVEASSEAEAIAKLFNGDVGSGDDCHVYLETAEDFGLPVDEHQQLADDLRKLGVPIKEIIPSIRRIERID